MASFYFECKDLFGGAKHYAHNMSMYYEEKCLPKMKPMTCRHGDCRGVNWEVRKKTFIKHRYQTNYAVGGNLQISQLSSIARLWDLHSSDWDDTAFENHFVQMTRTDNQRIVTRHLCGCSGCNVLDHLDFCTQEINNSDKVIHLILAGFNDPNDALAFKNVMRKSTTGEIFSNLN